MAQARRAPEPLLTANEQRLLDAAVKFGPADAGAVTEYRDARDAVLLERLTKELPEFQAELEVAVKAMVKAEEAYHVLYSRVSEAIGHDAASAMVRKIRSA